MYISRDTNAGHTVFRFTSNSSSELNLEESWDSELAVVENFSVASNPGLGVVLGVLVAGMSLAAFAFHAIRFVAARRFDSANLSASDLDASLGGPDRFGTQLRGS